MKRADATGGTEGEDVQAGFEAQSAFTSVPRRDVPFRASHWEPTPDFFGDLPFDAIAMRLNAGDAVSIDCPGEPWASVALAVLAARVGREHASGFLYFHVVRQAPIGQRCGDGDSPYKLWLCRNDYHPGSDSSSGG